MRLRSVRWLAPLVAAGLGLFQLGQPSLWVDEAFTWRSATSAAPDLTDELHAVYYLILRPWLAVAGTSEVALRLPSVLGAVVATVLLYGLTRRMFDERAAAVASLLLAVNPAMVQWSQQARSYTLLVCIVIASTWLLVRTMDRPDALAWTEYGTSILLMIVVQWFSAGLVLMAHVVMSWRQKALWVTMGLVGVASAPWMAHMLSRSVARGEQSISWIERPTLAEVGEIALHVPGALAVGLILSVVGAICCDHQRWFLIAWAFGPVLVSLCISAVEPVLVSRYLIVSTPAFAILCAVALTSLSGRLRTTSAVMFATGTVAALAFWYAPSDGDNWKGENWRAATAAANAEAIIMPMWAEPAFLYYGGRVTASGWVIERAERATEFDPAADARFFGERLRAVRVGTVP